MEKATVRSMQYWYGRVNRRAFHGELPRVRIEFVHSDEWLGQTVNRTYRLLYGKGAAPVGGRFIIRINQRLRFSRTACIQTLVHEMVHVSDWKLNHGRKFGQRIAEVMRKAKIESFL